jgi:pimeloyl-ACP methyl ester carboxylesterase
LTAYVLVHGAWHGAWCWERVGRLLAVRGDTVHTPTLSGLGERAHLLDRDVSLETHVRDVALFLESERLEHVVLVGHSYSGIVVTAAADRVPERIARVVYLDAVVPRNGECFYDRSSERIRLMFEEAAKTSGDGWLIPASVATAGFLGLRDDEDVRWVLPRLTPHPVRTFRETVRLRPGSLSMPRRYLNSIGDKPLGQPRSAQAEGIDDYYEVCTGHDAMVTAAEAVTALL